MEDATALQNELRTACSTLIYSRLLTKPQELDAYNAEVLRSSDEQTAPGAFAFTQQQIALASPLRKVALWFALIAIAGCAAAFFATRVLTTRETQTHGAVAALTSGLLLLFLLFGWIISRAALQFTPARLAIWRASRALALGRPVLMAASDAPPEQPLPPNIHFFLAQERGMRVA